MSELSQELAGFVVELDAAVEAHMNWTRRVLRCAVLRTSPGEDVLAPLAHTLCRFGRWFTSRQSDFEKLSVQKTQRLLTVHQVMHDAIRSICIDVLEGRPGQSSNIDAFEQMQTELIQLLAEFKTQFLATATQYDDLTGLALRRGLDEEFAQLQKLCKRNKLLLHVALIDVDNFKRINDSYGHPVGDIVLRHLADTLKQNIRPGEPLYRYGGDEFLLLMLTQTLEEAASAAERLVEVVRGAPMLIPQSPALTITMGLSCVSDDEGFNIVIERVDRALFLAKKAGRDRYVVAQGRIG